MEKHGHRWKGDNLGYAAAHSWLRVHHSDKKISCEECGAQDKLEFARRKESQYTRHIKDYRILCRKCHVRYDGIGKNPWNKGRKALYPKECEYCSEGFNGAKKRSRFCSNSCSAKSRTNSMRNKDSITGRWLPNPMKELERLQKKAMEWYENIHGASNQDETELKALIALSYQAGRNAAVYEMKGISHDLSEDSFDRIVSHFEARLSD